MSKWRLAAVGLCGILGCHEARPPTHAPHPPATVHAPSTSPATSSATTPTTPTVPQASSATDPTRVCVATDGTVTVEHDCGCNDALLCLATEVSPGTVSLAVWKDPNRLLRCLDCFPMVPGTCPLPTTVSGPSVIHAGAIELHVELHAGKPASRVCAASPT